MASVCVCSDYFEVTPSGELCMVPGSLGLREMLVFDTPGSHPFRPADYPWLARVRARVQGAGGGSAGAQAEGAGTGVVRGGASGGAYSESLLDVTQLGATETVVVGAGGAAGDPNGDGGNGGASSFGAHATAPGGNGSFASLTVRTTPATTGGRLGPQPGTGMITQGGGSGGAAVYLGGTQGYGGPGGDSRMGMGGVAIGARGSGSAARGPGGGAGGAFAHSDEVERTGQPGGHGIVVLELYG